MIDSDAAMRAAYNWPDGLPAEEGDLRIVPVFSGIVNWKQRYQQERKLRIAETRRADEAEQKLQESEMGHQEKDAWIKELEDELGWLLYGTAKPAVSEANDTIYVNKHGEARKY